MERIKKRGNIEARLVVKLSTFVNIKDAAPFSEKQFYESIGAE